MDSGDFLCHEIGRLGTSMFHADLKLVPRIIRGIHCFGELFRNGCFAHAGDPRRLLEVGDW